MAFVNEFVPEEQKTKFKQDQEVFHNPWTPRLPLRPYRWVVDRERNVFIIHLGADRPRPPSDYATEGKPREYMALSWNGMVVKFDATYEETGRYLDSNLVGSWEVIDIRIPPALITQRSAILELIREGLNTMEANTCAPDRLSKLNIHFNLKVQN